MVPPISSIPCSLVFSCNRVAKSVLFPLPTGPITASNSPDFSVKLIFSITGCSSS